MTATNRPPLGELKLDQPVMVRRSSNDSRGRAHEDRLIPAVVSKIARVWVELRAADSVPENMRWLTWRMRMDDQDEGSQYSGSNASFATMEQHAWDETRMWAFGVLKENGIRLESDSRWRGREAELADLISKEA